MCEVGKATTVCSTPTYPEDDAKTWGGEGTFVQSHSLQEGTAGAGARAGAGISVLILS